MASTVVALHAMMFASRRRLHWFMTEFLGVPSSLGTVDKTLMQGSQALEKPYEQAHQKVTAATYLGADETRWHKGKEHYVLWLAQCQDAAYYRLADNRRKETAAELLAGAQAKAIVKDRYGGYDWLGDKQQMVTKALEIAADKEIAKRSQESDDGRRRRSRGAHEGLGFGFLFGNITLSARYLMYTPTSLF